MNGDSIEVSVIFPQRFGLLDFSEKNVTGFGKVEFNYEDGIKTFRYKYRNLFPKLEIVSFRIWLKKGMELFEHYVERFGMPDVIHAHATLYAGVLASRIKQVYGVPFVITEHCTAYLTNTITPWQRRLASEAINDSSENLAVSKEFANFLSGYFSNTCSWTPIYNPLSELFENSNILPRNKKQADFIFFNASLFTPKKGIDILIKAFANTFNGNSRVKLRLAGDGPEREALERLVKELKAEEQVEFLGMLSRKQINSNMQNAHTYVLSSFHETFGVVIIESLSLGRPVIATRCGGPESFVTSGDGILVEKGDDVALGDAMMQMFLNYDTYDQESLAQRCRDNFGKDSFRKLLYLKYKNAISYS